ncbi:hypothetical protein Tco_1127730 [Tanacetum coccineum]
MIGELPYFLGLQIKQDDKGISICQEQYTRNLLKKYEISDSLPQKNNYEFPPNNLGSDSCRHRPFLCARYQSNPKESHLIAVKRILSDDIIKGDIELHFIPTEYQLADIFTKPLDEPTFTRLKAELGMLNIDCSVSLIKHVQCGVYSFLLDTISLKHI